ncbi:MAG TPA: response regulator transcription factor [Oscillatoriaceae cyanobacterium M33_DOE_052]|uniref:Response regulator transcription factor n=1 Tax=Planktothricoides sp. SpSt-374 TaxID=2282167 RepID=A0A7C3ZJF6_9CYAN|nr:response regulator transcription factor [Oscillatoriaceae cyanobacterium M33_DOE_052]
MPLTILVVDDDAGIRLAVGDYLEFCGYSVLVAENGKEALASLKAYRPQLIVTDAVMPEMDGFELVKQIRQIPSMRLLPVIFLTAHAKTQERILGYQLGCDIYLPKPFELEELGAVIRNLLERSQLIQAEWHFAAPSVAPPSTTAPPIVPPISLSTRETEVLQLLAMGLSNGGIGDRLHLSPRTVEKYVSSLLRKTDTANRAHLVRFAIEHHLI